MGEPSREPLIKDALRSHLGTWGAVGNPSAQYGVGVLAVTTLFGARTRLAHFNVGLVRCLSLHEHDAGRAPFKFGGKRSTHSHTVSTNVLRNGLSTWSPPPSCKMDWMD